MGTISDHHAAQIELWLRTDFGEGIGLSYDLHLPDMDDTDALAPFRQSNIPQVMAAIQNMCPILIGEHATTVALLDEALKDVEHVRIESPDDPQGYVQFVVVDAETLKQQRNWWNKLDGLAINGMDSTDLRGQLYLATREQVQSLMQVAEEASRYGGPNHQAEAYTDCLRMIGKWEGMLNRHAWTAYQNSIEHSLKQENTPSELPEPEAKALAATMADALKTQALTQLKRVVGGIIRDDISHGQHPFDRYARRFTDLLEPQMDQHLITNTHNAEWELAWGLQQAATAR
ncbi:hypothetical protein GC177_02260 [bacterium]|nr:hypothetical protein [bacterium]